jgi:hypothetical protein
LRYDLAKRYKASAQRSDRRQVLCQRHMVVFGIVASDDVMRVIRQYNRAIFCHYNRLNATLQWQKG